MNPDEIYYAEKIIEELEINNYIKMFKTGLITKTTLEETIKKHKNIKFAWEIEEED